MKFKIDSLVANFTDFARPNLYTVYIVPKRQSSSGVDENFEKLKFLAKSIQTPTLSAGGPIEVQHLNRKYKVAGDPSYEDITMTMLNDMDFTARQYFEEWYSQIHRIFKNGNPNDRWTSIDSEFEIAGGSSEEYMRDIIIEREDRKMNKVMSITLVDAFIVSIDGAELSYDSSDQIEEFTVNISFNNVNIDYSSKASGA